MGLLDQIPPRDVKSAFLDVVLAAQTAFPAPATAAQKIRYLLGVVYVNRSAANVQTVAIRVGAVDVFTFGPWLPSTSVQFARPIECGLPGANALTLMPINGAAQDQAVWVQFADLNFQLTQELFRT